MKYKEFIDFVHGSTLYDTEDFIPLHPPVFMGKEKEYLNDCIDSTFVSSVGKYVDKFERLCAEYTGSKYAVAVVNGTAALHTALVLSDVTNECEVLTQALTFVATTNAIAYTGASPIFIDVDKDTMGMSPFHLAEFLRRETKMIDGNCINKRTGKLIKACVPMHTFGFACRIEEILEVCERHNIILIEDAAESLGSFYNLKHTGTFGKFGTLSFNGNKTITCGGGGVLLTDDETLAKKAKHITTTAKIPHKWEYNHDMVGFNYRLTNLSAALGCAQIEKLNEILSSKLEVAKQYKSFFESSEIEFPEGLPRTKSNHWLNAVVLKSLKERDEFLDVTNSAGVMTRPIWKLMSELEINKGYQTDSLENSKWLEQRVVNIPSGVIRRFVEGDC